MQYSDHNILLVGSNRVDVLKQPLKPFFNVTTHKDIYNINDSVPSKIYKLFVYIMKNDPIIISDLLNKKSLLVGEMADRFDCPFVLRPIGTIIGEFEDRRRHQPFLRKYASVWKMRAIRDRLFRLADRIIPISHFIKNLVLLANLASPQDVKVVYDPYDERFTNIPNSDGTFKETIGIDEDSLLLLSVTGFTYKQKYSGIIDFSGAINSILRKYEHVHYAIVGGTKFPTGDAASISKEAETEIRESFSPDSQSKIHFPGHIQDIEQAYSESDIFLHLSYRDSLAKVVMEAGLFKLPVIVNRGGGMSELLPKLDMNLEQVTDDDVHLRKTIERLVESRDLRRHIGEQNKGWIERNFNNQSIGSELVKIIKELDQ